MDFQTLQCPTGPEKNPSSRLQFARAKQSAGGGGDHCLWERRDGWRAVIPGRDGCGDGTVGTLGLAGGASMRETADRAAGTREKAGDSISRRKGIDGDQAGGSSRGALQCALRARDSYKGCETRGAGAGATEHRQRSSATGQRRRETHAGSSSERARSSGAW